MIAGFVVFAVIIGLGFIAGAMRAAGNYDDRWGQ